MSQDSFPGDRPGDAHPEEDESVGKPPSEGAGRGFTPTDLARLFQDSETTPLGLSDSSPLLPGDAPPDWLAGREGERENITPKKFYEKEVKVAAVYEQTAITGARAFFVQLKDRSDREVKVYVGHAEATSISMAAEGYNFRRPLTHDLTKTIIERMGWKIDRILIDDLYNETFYAKLTLTRETEMIDIDCRPSDAIALALRARAPIYVAEDVLKAASREDLTAEEGDSSE